MGKGKGKNKKNPFIFFCLEKKASDPRYRGKSVKEMVALCSDEWNAMNAERKRPYHETADELSRGQTEPTSHNDQNMMEGKFDSFGCSMKAKVIAKTQDQALYRLMQEDVILNVKSEDVTDFRFHIMAAHSWVKLDCDYDRIPVEIALLEMSLKKGVMRKWLQKIDPGEIPTGYKAEMKLESEKNHKIWLDDVELTNAYGDVVNKIIEVLSAKENERYAGKGLDFHADVEPPLRLISAWKRRLLPIYCLKTDKQEIETMLTWLVKNSKPKIEVDFVLYDLEYLFQQLIVLAPNSTSTKLTIGAAEAYITRDVFLYLPAMSCKVHRDMESCNCAGARAARFAYVFTDFCCQMYGIMPKEGAHLPKGVALGEIVVGDPYPSFLDESENVLQNMSFLADFQMAEIARMEEIPEVCRLPVEFPQGTSSHMLAPMWTKNPTPSELKENPDLKIVYSSVDEFFDRQGLQNFDFDTTGLTGLDNSIFTKPLHPSRNTTKEETGAANDSFSFLDKFFDDPTLQPILKTTNVRENGKKKEEKDKVPDPFYDTRF